MISRAIYSLLSANAALTALVGTKIYPLRTPQTVEQPFVIYALSGDPVDTKDGVAIQEVYELQVTAFAKSYETGQGIVAAIRSALDRKSGTVQSNKIQTIVYEDSRENYDDKAELYRFDIAFTIRLNY